MPARRGAAIAGRLSPGSWPTACVDFDPRRARDLIRLIPADRVVESHASPSARGDVITMGRFGNSLGRHHPRVQAAIEDDGMLLRSPSSSSLENRLDHLVRLMGVERHRAIIRKLGDPACAISGTRPWRWSPT